MTKTNTVNEVITDSQVPLPPKKNPDFITSKGFCSCCGKGFIFKDPEDHSHMIYHKSAKFLSCILVCNDCTMGVNLVKVFTQNIQEEENEN